jgi:integrase
VRLGRKILFEVNKVVAALAVNEDNCDSSERGHGRLTVTPRYIKVKVRTRRDRHGRDWFAAYWYPNVDGQRRQRARLLGPVAGKERITKLQAETMAREIEQQLNVPPVPANPLPVMQEAVTQGIQPASAGLTLKECWEAWKHELSESHAQVGGTLYDKQSAFDKHIFPTLGDRAITAITRNDLQPVLNKMVSDAQSAGRGVTNVYKVRNYLSGLFTHLIKLQSVPGLENNPVRDIQLPPTSAPLKPQLPDETLLDQVARTLPVMSAILFDCLRTFGARPGEVTALQWKHVDFNTNTIDIVQHVRGGDVQQATKNQTTRRVDITPQLAQSLREWKSISQHNGDEDWVFPARTRECSNKPVRYNNLLRRDLKKACKDLGVRGINWKLLRHTFATVAVARGVDPVTLRNIMGHKDIRTTLTYYAHVDEEVRKNWILELSKRLYSPKKRVKSTGRKAHRHGRFGEIDATAGLKVMPQKFAGRLGIG